MRAQIRQGLNAGAVFGVVVIFLALTGFSTTAVTLLGGIFDNVGSTLSATPGAILNLCIFLVLFGLWAGNRGSKPPEEVEPSWKLALTGAVSAGLTAGLMIGVYAALVAIVHNLGVNLRDELTALSPQAIDLFVFGAAPVLGGVIHLVIMAIAATLGGVLTYSLRSRRQADQEGLFKRLGGWLSKLPIVQQIRASKHRSLIIGGILLIIVAVIPLPLSDYWQYTLGTVGIYVLLGLGLNIVVGMAGLLDLGYVAFFAIGAYTVALLTAPTPHGLLWSFWVALPIGILLAALAGILLGIPVLRMRGDYLAIVTLGFGEIIRILSKSDALTGFSGGPRGVRAIAMPEIFGLPFNSELAFFYLIVVACLVAIFVTSRLKNSRVGRAWVAMREDETVSQAMGINTWQYKLMAFAIGAAFAGLGGVIFASRNQFTGPEDHNLMVSINVLSLVIVGGMGSIPGVIAGSLALKGLPELLRQLETFRMLAFGGLLVAMMILRPEGLWPTQRRRLELHKNSNPGPKGGAGGNPGEQAARTGGESR